jgi:hypothetical protein
MNRRRQHCNVLVTAQFAVSKLPYYALAGRFSQLVVILARAKRINVLAAFRLRRRQGRCQVAVRALPNVVGVLLIEVSAQCAAAHWAQNDTKRLLAIVGVSEPILDHLPRRTLVLKPFPFNGRLLRVQAQWHDAQAQFVSLKRVL